MPMRIVSIKCLVNIKITSLRRFLCALVCVYWTVSVPLRIAFIPEYAVSSKYMTLALVDLCANILCIIEGLLKIPFPKGKAPVLPIHSSANASANIKEKNISLQDVEKVTFTRRLINDSKLPLKIIAFWVTILPLEYAALAAQKPTHSSFLINRTGMLLFIPSCISGIANELEERQILSNIGLQRTWQFFFFMALAGHWCGCVFFIIAKQVALTGNSFTWPQKAGLWTISLDVFGSNKIVMIRSLASSYLHSLYWAYITMTTAGFGHIVPLSISETLWCIVTMYAGLIITSFAVANLQLVVTNLDEAKTLFRQKMEQMVLYMRNIRLPSAIQDRILSYYDYQWTLLEGAEEKQILAELPSSIQQKVSDFLCRQLLSSLPALRRANNALLNAVTGCLEHHIFSPKDDIIRPGEMFRGTILVARGEIEVLKGNRVIRKMQRFDRYAEECLFDEKVCEEWIRAKKFCEIFLLPRDAFQTIVASQCDQRTINQMREAAISAAKASSKANKMFGSADEDIPKTGLRKHFLPNTAFRKCWDITTLIGFIFYRFSVPLHVMKLLEQGSFADNSFLFSVGYMFDFLFLLDLIFKYTCFAFVQEGIVVFRPDQIREHFRLTHNFVLEMIAMMPIDFLGLWLGQNFLHLLRLTKVLRIHRWFKQQGTVSLFQNGSHQRLADLNLLMIVVCHWVGCGWWFIAMASSRLGSSTNWIMVDENNPALAIDHDEMYGFAGYLRSIYWALVSMSTIGYGDILPTNNLEMMYMTIIILIGALVIPAIVGGLASYVEGLKQVERSHAMNVAKIRTYLIRKIADKNLTEKVLGYYDYIWSRQKGAKDTLEGLPGPLRQRVSAFVNGETVRSIPFFRQCDDNMFDQIVSLLVPRVYIPDDTIFTQGVIGREMFLIESGRVVACSANRKTTYNILGKGNFFGESALLPSTYYTATTYALTYCECFVLSRESFKSAMATFAPEYRRQIIHDAADVLQNTQEIMHNILQNFALRQRKCRQIMGGSDLDEKVTSQAHRRAQVLPDSRIRHFWNIIFIISVGYNAWMIPLRLAFLSEFPSLIIDWCLDVVLTLDIYFKMFEFAVNMEGELVSDVEKIKQLYMKNSFHTDLMSIIPYEVLALLVIRNNEFRAMAVALLRLPKLLRVGSFLGLLQDLICAFEQSNMNLGPIKLAQLLGIVILIAHWAACGFYGIAFWKNHATNCELAGTAGDDSSWGTPYSECLWVNTWIQRQIIKEKLPEQGGHMWDHYIRAFNWALPTLVVVVIGDVIPVTNGETLYVFLWILVGVTIQANMIGNIANLIANLEGDSSIFLKKADAINQFMYLNKISDGLQKRVSHFMNSLWAIHGGDINEEAFLHDLPPSLQDKVFEISRLKHVRNCPYFDFLTEDVVKALARRLTPLLFSAGDTIAYCGEMGSEMYFLNSGIVDIVSGSDERTVFATLTEGAFFGETSLFFKKKRESQVRAATFCQVFQLRKCDLDDELIKKDFDVSRMLDTFTKVAESNNRRNAAVARNLKTSKEKKSKLYKLINFDKDLVKERWEKVKSLFQLNSWFRVLWDVSCFLLTAYYLLTIPFTVAFGKEDIIPTTSWLVFEMFVSLFFVVDCIFRSSMFPFLHNGIIVNDKTEIFHHYQSNGMFLDVISCIPLSMWGYATGGKLATFSSSIQLLRVRNLHQYFSSLEFYLSLWGVRVSKALMVLVQMMFSYISINHSCACIWFLIHRYLERHTRKTWATTDCPGGTEYGTEGCLAVWDEQLGAHNVCNAPEMWTCYVRSFYFVLATIGTIGYGDISPATNIETIWENIVVLIGACMFAGVIGACGALLNQSDTSGSNSFRVKMQKLAKYMICRDFPTELRHEMVLYHQKKWQHSNIPDGERAMRILPFSLQMELSHEIMRKRGLIRIPIIGDCSRIIQMRLANALKAQVCPANSTVYSVGDIGWDIYFIVLGLVDAILPTEDSQLDLAGMAATDARNRKKESLGLTYKAGNHFGESALISKSGVRQETIRAVMLTELYHISKQDFETKILAYMDPEESKTLKTRLLNENGANPRVFHSFEDDNERDAKVLKELEENTWNAADEKNDENALNSIPRVSLESTQKGRPLAKISIASRMSSRKSGRHQQGRLTSFSAASLRKVETLTGPRHNPKDPIKSIQYLQSELLSTSESDEEDKNKVKIEEESLTQSAEKHRIRQSIKSTLKESIIYFLEEDSDLDSS